MLFFSNNMIIKPSSFVLAMKYFVTFSFFLFFFF